VGLGAASDCGVGWLAVSEGIVVEFGCESSILRI
jgi:hypothetical protein